MHPAQDNICLRDTIYTLSDFLQKVLCVQASPEVSWFIKANALDIYISRNSITVTFFYHGIKHKNYF